MQTEIKILTSADGHELECFMCKPDGDVVGGIVIIQEIFGVTDQLKELASQYSSLGYQVAIPALFDRHALHTVIPFDQGPKAMSLMEAAVPEQTLIDIDAAVRVFKPDSMKVAVMGFCWGGGLALRAAQKLDINGAIVFYGTRLSSYLDAPLKVPVLGHFGLTDTHVPLADVENAQWVFPNLEIQLYEAGHAFANHQRGTYVESAANLAHSRNQEYLQRVLC